MPVAYFLIYFQVNLKGIPALLEIQASAFMSLFPPRDLIAKTPAGVTLARGDSVCHWSSVSVLVMARTHLRHHAGDRELK